MTERITENLVRDELRKLCYYDPDNGVAVCWRETYSFMS